MNPCDLPVASAACTAAKKVFGGAASSVTSGIANGFLDSLQSAAASGATALLKLVVTGWTNVRMGDIATPDCSTTRLNPYATDPGNKYVPDPTHCSDLVHGTTIEQLQASTYWLVGALAAGW